MNPHRLRCTATATLLIVSAAGCQPAPPNKRPPATSRAELDRPPPATAPASAPTAAIPEPPPIESIRPDESPRPPERPKRPDPTWTVFMEAMDEKADADIVSDWTGGNRLEIKSKNVRKLRIDFRELNRRLPTGAPKRPPWNVQIDGQGIEITGRRGPFVELTRNDAGAWSVTGPRPPLPP